MQVKGSRASIPGHNPERGTPVTGGDGVGGGRSEWLRPVIQYIIVTISTLALRSVHLVQYFKPSPYTNQALFRKRPVVATSLRLTLEPPTLNYSANTAGQANAFLTNTALVAGNAGERLKSLNPKSKNSGKRKVLTTSQTLPKFFFWRSRQSRKIPRKVKTLEDCRFDQAKWASCETPESMYWRAVLLHAHRPFWIV